MANPRIDGIDWRILKKGDVIPHDHIIDYWNIHYRNKEWDDRYSMVTVKGNIEKLREGINQPIILKEVKGNLKVLTDNEAVDYSANQANAGIRKHRRHTRRLFTHIDAENLDEAKKRNLETKQIHHAFIAASADGARKQSLQLQRQGESLPKSLLKDSKLKPPDS
tara:strand:+ start:144 stop:638 length:495 start_codon:yes stop_codon:yes gene_type:complete